jgi:hypothetical protein
MKNLLTITFIGLATILFAQNKIKQTPFTDYNFDANKCKIIQHNQSRILIPANVFYLDGKLYVGEVNLKYREFTDQLDIVLNNIPMNYNANDKHHVLESAGMFEIYAYGNGKQLSFATGKNIQVQLATKVDMVGGETYVLDKQNKVWNKKTMFGNTVESNEVLTDNKRDLWNDDVWLNNLNSNEDTWSNGNVNNRRDTLLTYDPITGLDMYLVVSATNASDIRDQVFKTLNVDNMGMYNCDKILNEQTIPIVASFSLQGYKEKFDSEIFVVYKNRNAVLSYYPEQFANDFKLLPNEDFTIFSYAKDGKIAVLDSKFLSTFDAKLYNNKKVVFPLKVYPKAPTTKQELAAITGL